MSKDPKTADEIVYAGLRAWAKGLYHTEAAVELLIRGGWAQAWRPWIDESDNFPGDPEPMWWVDWAKLDYEMGPYSGGERRFLTAAVKIGRDDFEVSGLDRSKVDLILAAIAHAAGTHEGRHTEIVHHDDGRAELVAGDSYTSLHPWPA